MKIKKIKNKILKHKMLIISIILLSLLIIIIYNYNNYNNDITNIEDIDINIRKEEFNKLMNNFNIIFPDKNRNSGGPQFFKFIVDMNLSKEKFELYNSFYCGVSGSPIDPDRNQIFDYTIVKNINGEDIYGKYYRCCWPCICDIMKYAVVDKFSINLDGKSLIYDVLTIKDPCCNKNKIPNEVTSFKCLNNKTENGVYSDNGRLIFALFHNAVIAKKEHYEKIKDIQKQCEKRNNTSVENLKGGMGDIFVKLSIIC